MDEFLILSLSSPLLASSPAVKPRTFDSVPLLDSNLCAFLPLLPFLVDLSFRQSILTFCLRCNPPESGIHSGCWLSNAGPFFCEVTKCSGIKLQASPSACWVM